MSNILTIIQIDNDNNRVSQFLASNNQQVTNNIQDKITILYILSTNKHLLSPITLEDIFSLSSDFIRGIVLANKYQDQGDKINRLITTILFHNMGIMDQNDRKYVQNTQFNDVFINNNTSYDIRFKLSDSNTNVVCVKVADIRPKYHDLEEWCNDPNNVYIGRKGIVFITRNGQKYRYPHTDSIWANPFKIDNNLSRDHAINLYRDYITDKLRSGQISRNELENLRGKKLGCWCKEKGQNTPCHGDVLIDLLKQ